MTMTEPQLDAAFTALADPTRRAIVARLADGPATVKELAEPFPMSMQAVSRHVKVLQAAELLRQTVDAQRRPCHLEVEVMDQLAAWIDQLRHRWEQRLDNLDTVLSEIDQTGDR